MTVYPQTIDETIAAIGLTHDDATDLPVMRLIDGEVTNFLRSSYAGDPVQEPNIYVASGTFRKGSVRAKKGRSGDNLAALHWLPFDADLKDYLSIDVEFLHRMSDADIWREIAKQQDDLEEIFAGIGIPIHRLDYTGYGLCAYVYVKTRGRADVDVLREHHKRLVAEVNERASYALVDSQVSDAGPRVTRLPGSLNTKGDTPRVVETLYHEPGALTVDDFGPLPKRPEPTVIPDIGVKLSDAQRADIVDALKPSWQEGERHRIALGISGMLAKAGIPESEATAIITALSDGDDETRDRLKAVSTSYDRVRSGLQTRGFMSLRESLPTDALSFIDDMITRVREATGPRITVGSHTVNPETGEIDDAPLEKKPEISAPPDACFYGWFGEYRDLVAPTTEAPDAFHLGAALTLAGAMVGRRIHTPYASEPLFPNLYTVLVGASGSSRKDTAIKRALALPDIQQGTTVRSKAFYVARDMSSAEGLLTTLSNNPNTLLYLSELSTLLKNARRKGTATILDKLIESWDTPALLQNLSKINPTTAVEPYLSVLAATQPGRLASEMSDEDIHSGFANRWLYIPGEGKKLTPRPPVLDRPAAKAIYDKMHTQIMSYDHGTGIPLGKDTNHRWDEWYKQMPMHVNGEDEQSMRQRHALLAQKIALLFAISSDADAIQLQHLEPAIQLMEWMWGNVRRMLATWGVGTDSQIENSIIKALTQHKAMKRRDLQARTRNRKWTARDFAGTFDAMAKNQTIMVDASGIVSLPGDE